MIKIVVKGQDLHNDRMVILAGATATVIATPYEVLNRHQGWNSPFADITPRRVSRLF